jgi:A/G-specific adenine glycosylase
LAEVCTAYPLAIAPTQNATGRAKENVRGYEGTNRYYRGRILAALRDLESGQAESGIALSALAAQLKPETADDVSWLYEVVTGLEKDGLAQISEERPVYDPDDTGPSFVVRLPS